MIAEPIIERSAGLPTGVGAYLCGSGYTGITDGLDATVQRAAQTLADAYGMDVTIRFNSDRRSGGAWLKTDEPDGVWLNAEVGICARLVTQERNDYLADRYPEMAEGMPDPGLYVYAHIGKRVGEYAHVQVETIADALAYVQEHADLGRLA